MGTEVAVLQPGDEVGAATDRVRGGDRVVDPRGDRFHRDVGEPAQPQGRIPRNPVNEITKVEIRVVGTTWVLLSRANSLSNLGENCWEAG